MRCLFLLEADKMFVSSNKVFYVTRLWLIFAVIFVSSGSVGVCCLKKNVSYKIEGIITPYKMESGRDYNLEKVTVPLIAGFKLTAILISAFTAIKIFLMQSLFISKLAFIISSILVAKVVFDKMKMTSLKISRINHAPVSYVPYSNSYVDYHGLSDVRYQELDNSKYYNQWHEDFEHLNSNGGVTSITQSVLNNTSITDRVPVAKEKLENKHTLTSTPAKTSYGYATYVKRIIKEVTD